LSAEKKEQVEGKRKLQVRSKDVGTHPEQGDKGLRSNTYQNGRGKEKTRHDGGAIWGVKLALEVKSPGKSELSFNSQEKGWGGGGESVFNERAESCLQIWKRHNQWKRTHRCGGREKRKSPLNSYKALKRLFKKRE